MDKYDLYERAAQWPRMQAAFLRALLPDDCEAPVLGEDFSGTGGVARAWVRHVPGAWAVCADHDPEPLQRCRDIDRLTTRCQDVMAVNDKAHAIAVLNFSICEWLTRPQLLAYLRHARSRLEKDGVFVADLYGGEDAFAIGESDVEIREPEPGAGALPEGVRYVWEQREADPLTARVVNAMHFQLPSGAWLRDAFVYDWRLWSVPELREAMHEAGFARTEVYDRLGDAIDTDGRLYVRPVESPDELDENYIVFVAAFV